MGETPMSALTLLCSGIQLYSAEQRIADCILADVKWAASATSAELARQSPGLGSHGDPAVPQTRL